MRKFLKFVHDDNVYCKYYEVFYILFHTGLRISEFCGLTIKDIDLKNRIYQYRPISFSELAACELSTSNPRKQMPVQESFQ